MNSLLQGKQQAVAGFLNSVFRYLDTKNDSVELSEVAKVRWFLFDLRVRSIMYTAAERFLKKLSLMTYASYARVITVIIQTNLIHLSIKMTMPHQSGAPFVGKRGVFKIEGFAGKRSLLSPPPPPPFHLFALAPFFARPECKKLIRAARILFASYGNACYAG